MSVLGEPLVLFTDLEGQLPGVAHDQDGDLAVGGLDLLESGQDEDGRLSHAGLGLAQDVHAQHGLRDALVLHLGRVLKAAVDDCAQQLRLEEEVTEAGRVDADGVASGAAERERRA